MYVLLDYYHGICPLNPVNGHIFENINEPSMWSYIIWNLMFLLGFFSYAIRFQNRALILENLVYVQNLTHVCTLVHSFGKNQGPVFPLLSVSEMVAL